LRFLLAPDEFRAFRKRLQRLAQLLDLLERDALVPATLLGAAATFTRPVAPAVVLGLLIRQLERRRQKGEPIRWKDFLPLLALGGIGMYMLHLGTHFGDPLAFLHVQSAPGWDQPPGWYTWLKITWFHILFPKVAPLVAFRLIGHAVVALGALALVPATRRHLGLGYAAYTALAVGVEEPPQQLRIVRDPQSIAAHTSGYFRGWQRGQEIGGYAVGQRDRAAWEFNREQRARESEDQRARLS